MIDSCDHIKTEADATIHPCSLLMITVETENYNLISKDFYDKTVLSP